MAQVDNSRTPDVPLRDNAILEEFEIPFGSWFDQMVDWLDLHFSDVDGNWFPLLDWIEWPFRVMLSTLVDGWLLDMSWTTFCLGIFCVGWLFRNATVGFVSAMALAGCGLLGNEYWLETARTVGFVGVAVVLCIIVGIPVGVMCGRFDGVWSAVRPALDAMQVVHSFVYMMPFIFFFGIGEESATMVTMVYAVPPLIRLTNLGIRQVPEEVVEASRAFGASERRVLTDVQLPLAKPAIMTGINQTLLLSVSMIGVAAIMGAGGLGRLLFQSLSNLDVSQAASAGTAFFLVAVALDRLTQPETSDGTTLFSRAVRAWSTRNAPELNLSVPLAAGEVDDTERPAAIEPRERSAIVASGLLAGFVVAASFLPWGRGAGLVSGHARRSDEVLSDMSFSGIDASGGSWFGLGVFGLAMFVVYVSVSTLFPRPPWVTRSTWTQAQRSAALLGGGLTLLIGVVVADVLFDSRGFGLVVALGLAAVRPGRRNRWIGADGQAIASLALFVAVAAYALMNPAVAASSYRHGFGIYLAALASAGLVAASLRWLTVAPYSPYRPLKSGIDVGRLIGAGAAMAILTIGAFSGWSFDARADAVVTPEVQAEIDRLTELGRTDPANAAAYAAEISAYVARIQTSGTIVLDGLTGAGTQLGLIALVVGLLGAAATAPAAGWRVLGEQQQFVWSSVACGLGVGTALIPAAWIASVARTSDPNLVSGAGAIIAFTGGVAIVAANVGVVRQFFRSVVFDDTGLEETGSKETGFDACASSVGSGLDVVEL